MTEHFSERARRVRQWAADQAGLPLEQTQYGDFGQLIATKEGRVIARKSRNRIPRADGSVEPDWFTVGLDGEHLSDFVE